MQGPWPHIQSLPNGVYIMVVPHSGDTGTISITLGSCRGHIISKNLVQKVIHDRKNILQKVIQTYIKRYLYKIKKSLKLPKALSEAWRYNEQKEKHKNIEEKNTDPQNTTQTTN